MTGNDNELIIGIDRDGKPVTVTLIIDEDLHPNLRRYWRDPNAQPRHGKSNLLASHMVQELILQGREENSPPLWALDGKSIFPAWEKPRCRGAACPYCRGLPGGCPSED